MGSSSTVALIALWVSGVSVLIAVASLGWNIYTAIHLNGARIAVAIAEQVVLSADGRKDIVTATVTNVGRERTTLLSVWLCVGPRPSLPRRIVPKRLRPKVGIMTRGYDMNLTTVLPTVLEPGGMTSAVMPAEFARRALASERSEHCYATATTSTAGSRSTRTLRIS